jgi:hypothetical protein
MKSLGRILLVLVAAGIAVNVSSCNNSLGGFSGSVGNTPDVTPETAYKVFGNIGMPFTALVSDERSSWTVQGNAPLSISIVNAETPSRIIATKLVSDNSLMSIEIINGIQVADVASTTDPYGTASAQIGGLLIAVAPTANPNLEISVPGPMNEGYEGLIEDSDVGFTVSDVAPAFYLFDVPVGKVTAQLEQVQELGALVAYMTLNGVLVSSAAGANDVVRSP